MVRVNGQRIWTKKRNEEHYRGEHFKWVYAIVRTKSYWILWGIVHNLCTLLVLFVFLSWFDGFSLSTHSQMCVRTYTMIQKWSHHWSCVNCWTNKSWQFGLKSENMFVSVNMWKGKNTNTHTHTRESAWNDQHKHFVKWNLPANVIVDVFTSKTRPISNRMKLTHIQMRSHKNCECLPLLFAYCIYGVRLCVLSVFILLFIQKWTNLFYFISTGLNNNLLLRFSGHHSILSLLCIHSNSTKVSRAGPVVAQSIFLYFSISQHCHINTFRRKSFA